MLTSVCLETVALQPTHGLGKFTIAISCRLPEVRELKNIDQAFDSNLAFSTGDVIEMNF